MRGKWQCVIIFLLQLYWAVTGTHGTGITYLQWTIWWDLMSLILVEPSAPSRCWINLPPKASCAPLWSLPHSLGHHGPAFYYSRLVFAFTRFLYKRSHAHHNDFERFILVVLSIKSLTLLFSISMPLHAITICISIEAHLGCVQIWPY